MTHYNFELGNENKKMDQAKLNRIVSPRCLLIQTALILDGAEVKRPCHSRNTLVQMNLDQNEGWLRRVVSVY